MRKMAITHNRKSLVSLTQNEATF